MEGGRESYAVEQDSGYHPPNQGAKARLADDTDPSDCAGENVRARDQYEEQYKHDACKLVAKPTPHQSYGVGVVLDMRVLQPDLPDDVAGVDGDKTETHGHNDAGYHA